MSKLQRSAILGEGTYGIVYEAKSPGGHNYAIKRNLKEDKTCFIGILREVDILANLRHPHVLQLKTVILGEPFANGSLSPLDARLHERQQSDKLHFVFNRESYDLHSLLHGEHPMLSNLTTRKISRKAMPCCNNYELLQRYMVHMLLGVEYIHGCNIIHRDIKPTNILIAAEESDPAGNIGVAKLCDFGLAKPYTKQGQQTPCVATVWYRAPEVLVRVPNYNYSIDAWAIGCVLFEMVARQPYVSFSHTETNEEVMLQAVLDSIPDKKTAQDSLVIVKRFLPNFRAKRVPVARRSLFQRFALTSEAQAKFNREAGPLDSFIDMVSSLLAFDWTQRSSVTQALNHSFFVKYRPYISAMRASRASHIKPQFSLPIFNAIERRWAASRVSQIYNYRDKFAWYSHRILFQAMDLYDRFLAVMFTHTKIAANAVESSEKGKLFSFKEAELRWFTCLYMAVKYFTTIQQPTAFELIMPPNLQDPASRAEIEALEASFVVNCLQYVIYRPTIYESADSYDDILTEPDVRDMIMFYSQNNSFSGYTPLALYDYYRTHLRGKKDMSILLQPLPVLTQNRG